MPRVDGLVADQLDLHAIGAGEHGRCRAVVGAVDVHPGVVERASVQNRVVAQIELGAVHRLGAVRHQTGVNGDVRVRVDLQAACGRIGVTLLAGLAVFAVRHPRVQAERPRRRLVAIIAGADRDGHALVVQLVRGGDGDVERIAVEVREAQ